MTTLALVAGMIPILIGQGPAAESHRGIAVVVIGGQSLCLLITLLVTPVAYSLFDDIEAWLGRTVPALRNLPRRLFRRRPVQKSPPVLDPRPPPGSAQIKEEEAFGD